MSVIAWDGKVLATDMQGSHSSGLIGITPKLRRLKTGNFVAITGDIALCQIAMLWIENGCKPEMWPSVLIEDGWGIVTTRPGYPGAICELSRYPTMEIVYSQYWAWGAGQDLAIGALAMGATAVQAVNVACNYSDSCGGGILHVDLSDPNAKVVLTQISSLRDSALNLHNIT